MSKQVLSIEQMKHLQELGLDTSKASMHYWIITNGEYSQEIGTYVFGGKPTCTSLMLYPYKSTSDAAIRQVEDVPTFTFQDILDILPQEIIYLSSSYSLFIEYQEMRIAYCYVDREGIQWVEPTFGIGENLIDGAYKMLCWCIENGYVKTNKL